MGARGATVGLGIHGEQGIAVTHRWWRRREDGGAGRGAAVARRRGDGWWRLDVQHGEDVATAVAASSKTVEARAMSHCDEEETARWPAEGRGHSAAAPPWCTGRCSEDDDVERALGVRSHLCGGSAAMKARRRWWRRRGCSGSRWRHRSASARLRDDPSSEQGGSAATATSCTCRQGVASARTAPRVFCRGALAAVWRKGEGEAAGMALIALGLGFAEAGACYGRR